MEPLACVLRGQRKARLRPAQTVLVLGSGISGLLHISLARTLGAGLVVAADTIPFRLNKAEEMGAHNCLKADESLIASLMEVNDGRLADVVIICFEGFIPLGLRTVEKGGTVLFFSGASEGATIPIPINDLFWRTEMTLTSTYAGAPYDCDHALKLIKAGSVPVKKTITHRLAMADAPQGFERVCSPVKYECVKVIIEPQI